MKAIVHVERINNFEYSFKSSNRSGMKAVATALTFKNPDPFAYSEEIRVFNRDKLTFKIGMLKTLKTYLKENNINLYLSDYEYEMPDIDIDNRLSGKYEYQRRAVLKFYSKRFGIIKVPTRGGKTFLAAEIVRLFLLSDSGNFLFVTDNTTLFTQAVNDFQTFFKPYGGLEVGEIKSGIMQFNKRVTVAMIQTIQVAFSKRNKDKKKKRDLTKYLRSLKFLCVDEIHDNSSETRMGIYKKCVNLEYQLCLSATPYKDDELKKNLKLQAWSGGIIFDIKESTLREKEVLSDYKVFVLFIDHTEWYLGENDDYAESKKTVIVYNSDRNEYILKVVEILKRLNKKTLLLFQDIAHGNEISKITGIPFISGKTKNEEREEAKNNFLKEKGGFLLASGIFKKGITLPEVEVMINVDGGLQGANTIQKKGRVLGVTDDKKRSLIIDFFDHDNNYFSEHSEARLLTYEKAIGEENIGILDVSALDCFKILEKWIEMWFEEGNGSLDIQ